MLHLLLDQVFISHPAKVSGQHIPEGIHKGKETWMFVAIGLNVFIYANEELALRFS